MSSVEDIGHEEILRSYFQHGLEYIVFRQIKSSPIKIDLRFYPLTNMAIVIVISFLLFLFSATGL